MQRFWYASIATENDGSWYGKFRSKRERDQFCKGDHVWVLRNAGWNNLHGGWYGVRVRVSARISPVTAAVVRSSGKSVTLYE